MYVFRIHQSYFSYTVLLRQIYILLCKLCANLSTIGCTEGFFYIGFGPRVRLVSDFQCNYDFKLMYSRENWCKTWRLILKPHIQNLITRGFWLKVRLNSDYKVRSLMQRRNSFDPGLLQSCSWSPSYSAAPQVYHQLVRDFGGATPKKVWNFEVKYRLISSYFQLT